MSVADVQVHETPAPLVLPPARARRVIAVMRAELPKAAAKLTARDEKATTDSRSAVQG